jgi:phage terminase large subunit-like protein
MQHLDRAALLERFERTVLRNPWVKKRPHPRQAEFLLTPHREVLFGGAARGGKSVALLTEAARDVDVPGYSAIIFRRSLAEHMQPEGLISESKDWWLGQGPDYSEQWRRWTFPSGATIHFGYLDKPDDIYRYRGGAYHCVVWDELTDFEEQPYRFMFTRQSRPPEGPLSRVPLRFRAGSNPGGRGAAWVKKRFIDSPGADRFFVPSRVRDNPSVDYGEYVRSLENADPLTRRQYLDGDWTAAMGGRFLLDWLRRRFGRSSDAVYGHGGAVVLYSPDGRTERVFEYKDCFRFQTCDPAATARDWNKRNHDPDYTAVSTFLATPENHLLWLDCQKARLEVPDIVPFLEGAYDLYRPAYVAIEAFAANRAVAQLARRTRMNVKMLNPKGRDKVVRATPAMNLCRDGRVYFFDGHDWDEEHAELLSFTGDGKGHDDVVDTFGYAADCLADEGRDYANYSPGRPFVIDSRGY